MGYRQARWDEPFIFELDREGRVGYLPPSPEEELVEEVGDLAQHYPAHLLRGRIGLPRIAQPQVVRHFTRLTQMNFGVDTGSYPLGSCTMKYSPRIAEAIASKPELANLHPLQPEETVQGLLEILYELSTYLAEITGMDAVSLQPAAGAQGELTGALIMRKYHEVRGELEKRREILVPDSAHGTNPVSARMAGFRVVEVPSGGDGCVDMDALKALLSEETAGLMLTNPNTLGIFERRIEEIAEAVHGVGALLYYDGANLNAIAGISRPGDMGFDIVHLNLHKTFSTPHGGGGPGAGPVGVKAFLRDYLPTPLIGFDGERYYLDYDLKHSVGRVHSFYGNIAVLLKAYIYIRLMGGEGLKRASQIAVLNSNYLLAKLRGIEGLDLPYDPEMARKHEFVLSFAGLKEETGVRLLDIAKRLLDQGVHAPTIYFPLIVEEAFMAEPTETESKEELDRYVEAVKRVVEEARRMPERVLKAPYNTSRERIDEARASRPKTITPSHRWRGGRDEKG